VRNRIVALALALLLVGMVIAGVIGGVSWLIGVGGAGTALGTLGLAYFTYAVADRTTALAEGSQRLETAATGQLAAATAQAKAAAATAREAQQAGVDALSPIIDLQVEFIEGIAQSRAASREQRASQRAVLSTHPGQKANPRDLDFSVDLSLLFENLGRTPAFVTTKHSGAAFDGQGDVIRVQPGAQHRAQAKIWYAGIDDPFATKLRRSVTSSKSSGL
jgi:hypothetical protein